MLAVRFAEVKRTATKELGFNMAGRIGNEFTISTGVRTAGTGSALDIINGGTAFVDIAKFTSALFNPISSYALIFDALEEKGAVKTLAEPTLMALSGETASFLAGGEFPIPVLEDVEGTGQQSITVEFKEFGVSLAFTPTVLDNGRISLVVLPEVSAIDPNAGTVLIGNAEVPSLITRRASTTIELGDGQSFVIAGLLENNYSNAISQFPWLGDLPIIGALFRSTNFKRSESELMILVTPYIVKPAAAGTLIGSADLYKAPSDVDLFFHGRIDAPGSGMPQAGMRGGAQGAGGISGPYGHIIK
jgi:pilus assembly protein CpaC